MKALFILVLLAIVLAGAGYLTYTRNAHQASVTLETQKLKEDAERVIEKTRTVSEDARRSAPKLRSAQPSEVRHEEVPANSEME